LRADIVGLDPAELCLQQLKPARPDDSNEHVAPFQRGGELLVEPLPSQQIVDIHEDAGPTETGGERVAQSGGGIRHIVAAIADENPGHDLVPRLPNPSVGKLTDTLGRARTGGGLFAGTGMTGSERW